MRDKSPAITILRWFGRLLPGDYLKTTGYLYIVVKPRKLLRLMLNGFYRMEHIYDVLKEAKRNYGGKFSIIELGTNEGYALVKMLYATRYLKLTDRVTVHGFDSFEGMPSSSDRRDRNIVYDDEEWGEGQFEGKYDVLDRYCASRYSNYRLHKGFFEDSLTDEFLETLTSELPILVWVDCDFYTSARAALERLIPYLPTGCVVYFDEYEFNFGSRFTGEARIVHELNRGDFGEDIELILDSALSLDSKRVYRFIRFSEGGSSYERLHPLEPDPGRRPTNGSPLP